MFLLSSLAAIATSGGKAFLISVDPTWGCFGFLNSEQFFSLIVLQGILSGFFGTWGQLMCILYHAPVVTHSCLLIVPYISEAIAFTYGID